MAQVVSMMPRHVPDTCVVLGPDGNGSHHNCSHLRSQLRGCEQRCERIREHQLHDQTRPTRQLPHAPYTTPYAWEVHWWAPQSWVTSHLFTPLFTLLAGPSRLSVRSRRYLRNAFDFSNAVSGQAIEGSVRQLDIFYVPPMHGSQKQGPLSVLLLALCSSISGSQASALSARARRLHMLHKGGRPRPVLEHMLQPLRSLPNGLTLILGPPRSHILGPGLCRLAGRHFSAVANANFGRAVPSQTQSHATGLCAPSTVL